MWNTSHGTRVQVLMIKHKKLHLRATTIRNLTAEDLDIVKGGLPTSGPVPNSNLTCGAGCKSIYCDTNYVSCPAACTLR